MSLNFDMQKELKISDDSGFIAIVNPDKYISFVDENWELEQLMNHFVKEMNRNSLVIWGTGAENIWNVLLTNRQSINKPFREFTKAILVTNEKLYLTNYEDLTMAAQFKDEVIPSKHNADLVIQLENGLYNLTIKQLFDPDELDFDKKINFEVIIQPSNGQSEETDKIYWWTK